MSFPYRITPTSITIHMNGRTYVLTEDSHQHYTTIREAIRTKEFDKVEQLIDLAREVETFGKGKIKVVNGVVMYGDFEVHNTLTRRMLEQMAEGFDVEPMVNFLENLMQNPSKRAVDELYDFLEACNLPITDDGHFVAYKKVRHDYLDIYTGKISNAIGEKPSMARNMVDEEKSRTCSQGLHFCSESYLSHYSSYDYKSDKIMIVKINPRDVVAIPADYNNAKGRCCLYEVIGEANPEDLKFYKTPVYNVTGDDTDADGEFDDEDDENDDFFNDDDDGCLGFGDAAGCEGCFDCDHNPSGNSNYDEPEKYELFSVYEGGDEVFEEACYEFSRVHDATQELFAEDPSITQVVVYDKNGDVHVRFNRPKDKYRDFFLVVTYVDGTSVSGTIPYTKEEAISVARSYIDDITNNVIRVVVVDSDGEEEHVEVDCGVAVIKTTHADQTDTGVITATPAAPAVTFTKPQLIAVFGNEGKVDMAIAEGKVEVHATPNGMRYTIK